MLTRQDKWDIIAMHEYRRPHDSPSEKKFIERFIKPLGVTQDGFGNLTKIIPGHGDAKPDILWSCHTDTVHTFGGYQWVDSIKGVLQLPKGSPSNCLGADCGAGIWLLCKMIKAGVPGLYVFHRLEEKGGQGSNYILKNNKSLLEGIKAAIAFDRKGTKSVITHQFSSRSCSDAFGKSLASAIGLKHELDAGGMFTDTEVYREIIPECTNVSVGYENAHWRLECLNMHYLVRLRDAMLNFDASKLVIERDPSEIELPWWVQNRIDRAVASAPSWAGSAGAMTSNGAGGTSHLVPKPYSGQFSGHWLRPRGFLGEDQPPANLDKEQDWHGHQRCITLADFCKAYPNETADYLETLGVNAADIREYVDKAQGVELHEAYGGF